MRRFASTSWRTVWLLALSWVVAWLLTAAIAVWLSARDLNTSSPMTGGGFAAIGVGLTSRGVAVIFGPPLTFLVLRLIVARFSTR